MGGHNTGFLGQNDIDPDMHEAMAEFRKKILANQPNMVTAWMTLLDPGKANRCPKEQFLKVCDDIGCKEQGKKLFKWFDFNHSGDITLEEIDPMAYLQMQRGDHELGLLVNEHEEPRKKTEMTFWERSTTECSRRYAASGKAAKEAIEAAAAAAAGSDIGASSLAGFKGMLMRRYGNVFRAWKDVLDTDKSGKLSFYEFCVSVRNLGYSGNMKALWHALDKDQDGFIQLEDISPEEGALMKDFK